MIKKELMERLEAILNLLGDDICPTMDDRIIDVAKIEKVNKATTKAYNDLDILMGDIKHG